MKRLKIAIQKSGRLHEASLQMLAKAGIRVDNGNDRLKVAVKNFPIEILYLRNGDIPHYLADGTIDAAIIGENVLIEQDLQQSIVQRLNFSKCRLSIAIPNELTYNGIKSLEGKKIATSYPKTVHNFLTQKNIKAELHQLNGSVEIAPNMGMADAIVDIVSTGNTLFKNNLKEVEQVLTSEAVLSISPKLSPKLQDIVEKLLFRLRAVLQAKNTKYILLNAPNDKVPLIINDLPGMKSPTVLPLAEKGWSSIHSVIHEETFWEVIDQLKKKGAEGILICPIEKMVL
ncbi:ATP phosphoribosyltransferase [Mesonia aquimarina]|uniref:ATP phosphoribosyltransferase n=1 Tax=Mesonia aquimarina TaxID=1504967 RepID=UPI000EF58E68|nr:ATP phosphoribosyltransferase [Mesonia aquimarina]